MANRKPKPSYLQRKQKETFNKKAVLWVGSIIGFIIVVMVVLLIWNP
ncbi:MAG: hypothetical protein K0Q59_3050 [Paenibacillus sp.]|jgi:hypothetical protein|nr:hypothetical protein [Paenibacillus sp.]